MRRGGEDHGGSMDSNVWTIKSVFGLMSLGVPIYHAEFTRNTQVDRENTVN